MMRDQELHTTEALLRLRRGLQAPGPELRGPLVDLALGLEHVRVELSTEAQRVGAALTVGAFARVSLGELGTTMGELLLLGSRAAELAREAWRRAVMAVPG